MTELEILEKLKKYGQRDFYNLTCPKFQENYENYKKIEILLSKNHITQKGRPLTPGRIIYDKAFFCQITQTGLDYLDAKKYAESAFWNQKLANIIAGIAVTAAIYFGYNNLISNNKISELEKRISALETHTNNLTK